MATAISTKTFSGVSIPSSGLEIKNILGGAPNYSHGYLKQIIIRASSGGGATMDVQIRLESNDSSLENLVYRYNPAGLPDFIDSGIDAPFDLKGPNSPSDLILYINPASAGVFEIRLDFELLGR